MTDNEVTEIIHCKTKKFIIIMFFVFKVRVAK